MENNAEHQNTSTEAGKPPVDFCRKVFNAIVCPIDESLPYRQLVQAVERLGGRVDMFLTWLEELSDRALEESGRKFQNLLERCDTEDF